MKLRKFCRFFMRISLSKFSVKEFHKCLLITLIRRHRDLAKGFFLWQTTY